MARFTCAGKLPAALCNSIYNKALSADLAGRALFCTIKLQVVQFRILFGQIIQIVACGTFDAHYYLDYLTKKYTELYNL